MAVSGAIALKSRSSTSRGALWFMLPSVNTCLAGMDSHRIRRPRLDHERAESAERGLAVRPLGHEFAALVVADVTDHLRHTSGNRTGVKAPSHGLARDGLARRPMIKDAAALAVTNVAGLVQVVDSKGQERARGMERVVERLGDVTRARRAPERREIVSRDTRV